MTNIMCSEFSKGSILGAHESFEVKYWNHVNKGLIEKYSSKNYNNCHIFAYPLSYPSTSVHRRDAFVFL